jgi:hypothetical protein
MKRVALAIAVLVSTGSSASAQQWIEYRPPGAGYRIEFPGQPAEETREVATNVGKIRMSTSAVEIGDKVFLTITSHYPQHLTMGDPEKNLDGARNGSLRNINGTLRHEERVSVGDAPARRLLIDIPRDNQAAGAVMVLDGHQLLQAIYVGPRGTEEAPEVRRFLSSLSPVR